MPEKINLLPIELSAKGNIAKTATLLKKLAIAGSLLFLVLGGLAVIYIVFISIQVKSLEQSQKGLKTNIQRLEQTEQEFFLIKDRVQKADSILARQETIEGLGKLNEVILNLPPETFLSESEISEDKSKLTFMTKKSSSLVTVLGFLATGDIYEKLILKNFSYNPVSGFLVRVETF